MTEGDAVTEANADTRAELGSPAPPEVVSERFGEFEELLSRYAGWLAGAGTVRGLIGPREVPRLWDRHILNSAALSELLPVSTRVVDIGTGAGLPGIAVACIRPDLTVDLVESLQRRTDFLREVVADLGLTDRVRVVRGRAEDKEVVDAVGSSTFVTARAVAPIDKLARWSVPLLAPGGSLLALKGSGAEGELTEHRTALRKLRMDVVGVHDCGVGWLSPPTRVVEIVRR
jgi:16S rRNA (guanine527-N7)-methyltransferase